MAASAARPLQDRVVSAAALHPQRHRLSAPDGQRIRAEHAVRLRDFRILHGEPAGWHHTSPNGTAVILRFGGTCGTRLYGERDGRPEIVSLRAGTVGDTSWLVPVAHFPNAARSHGCSRRPARSVSRLSPIAGEAYCPDGELAGPTRPMERRAALVPPSHQVKAGSCQPPSMQKCSGFVELLDTARN
ncbi:GFA family protein [Bradyrhizobium roseum]|uniref:GFA family protein n=1 Tax=Bradyrhizobium roseum TaxID=3056648 RepID=UPI00387E9BA5